MLCSKELRYRKIFHKAENPKWKLYWAKIQRKSHRGQFMAVQVDSFWTVDLALVI